MEEDGTGQDRRGDLGGVASTRQEPGFRDRDWSCYQRRPSRQAGERTPSRVLKSQPRVPAPPRSRSLGIKFRARAGAAIEANLQSPQCDRKAAPAVPVMASDELAQKLQRRLLLEEGSPEPAAGGEANPAGGGEEEEDRSFMLASADSELGAKLSRRQDINEGMAQPRQAKVFNPYTEFKEFSRRQIKDMERMFKLYDSGKDGYIDLMELKLMMEKLGAPQTHLGLKNMIKEVDEDFDGKLSFREFLLIFHKAAAGELEEDSGLMTLAKLSEIDVSIEGVKGAKNFFEAKVQALSSASKFEAEIKAEQDERKREEEEKKHRRAAFRELKSAFSQ